MPARTKSGSKDSTANIGFEAKLWLAADKLRNNIDAAEYKHVVVGLIFLKYISDTFEEHHTKLVERKGECEGADPEDQDEPSGARQTVRRTARRVPPSVRWARAMRAIFNDTRAAAAE